MKLVYAKSYVNAPVFLFCAVNKVADRFVAEFKEKADKIRDDYVADADRLDSIDENYKPIVDLQTETEAYVAGGVSYAVIKNVAFGSDEFVAVEIKKAKRSA